jgi:hypothetical protein
MNPLNEVVNMEEGAIQGREEDGEDKSLMLLLPLPLEDDVSKEDKRMNSLNEVVNMDEGTSQ